MWAVAPVELSWVVLLSLKPEVWVQGAAIGPDARHMDDYSMICAHYQVFSVPVLGESLLKEVGGWEFVPAADGSVRWGGTDVLG